MHRIIVFAAICCAVVARPSPSRACNAFDADPRAWTAFLGAYVRDGRVDYAAIKQKGRHELTQYLDHAAATCRDAYLKQPKSEQLALLINIYNAGVLKVVVDHYPIDSIRSISNPDAFKRPVVATPLSPEPVTLDALENQIIRPGFGEPRVHFALVCAAVSCPRLRSEAYTGSALEKQLDDQAKRFLTDGSNNRFDAATKTLYLSSIFEWFKGDFEAQRGSVQAFVADRIGKNVAGPDIEVRYLDYDWSLNAQR